MASAFVAPLIGLGAQALGGAIGGAFGDRGGPTPIQQKQQELIDQLLASLQGQGPYSDLFKMDEDTFNKSYLEPAKARFNQQIAPQILQNYISSGQQRGTGLEDTLQRAGVDMDMLLNQAYAQMQQQAQRNQQNAIGGILNAGSGAKPPMSRGQAIGQGIAGALTGQPFGQGIQDVGKGYNEWQNSRSGFTQDGIAPGPYGRENMRYNPYTDQYER
jgi:hypothetical protein